MLSAKHHISNSWLITLNSIETISRWWSAGGWRGGHARAKQLWRSPRDWRRALASAALVGAMCDDEEIRITLTRIMIVLGDICKLIFILNTKIVVVLKTKVFLANRQKKVFGIEINNISCQLCIPNQCCIKFYTGKVILSSPPKFFFNYNKVCSTRLKHVINTLQNSRFLILCGMW